MVTLSVWDAIPASLTTQVNATLAVAPLSLFLFHLMPGIKGGDMGLPEEKKKKKDLRGFGAPDSKREL